MSGSRQWLYASFVPFELQVTLRPVIRVFFG